MLDMQAKLKIFKALGNETRFLILKIFLQVDTLLVLTIKIQK